MNSYLAGYEEYRGDFHRPLYRLHGVGPQRQRGHLRPVSPGAARQRLFVVPGDPVYEGMIVGEHNLDSDLNVNPAKEKKLSNMRSVSRTRPSP